MTSTDSKSRPTRERILDNALRLFAEQGYEATSIGEIETAAGLVPRSGGLYKHFPSKRALIDAALAERFGGMDELDRRIELMPLGDIRAELLMIGRLALEELEAERELISLVMKEGERFPELADAFHVGIVRRSYLIAAAWLASRQEALGSPLIDVEAAAQVLTSSLVGYVLEGVMFGARTADRPDGERLIAAWAEIVLDHLESDRRDKT